PRYLVGSAMALVMAQRLGRRVCERCKELGLPEPELLAAFGSDAELLRGRPGPRGGGGLGGEETGYGRGGGAVGVTGAWCGVRRHAPAGAGRRERGRDQEARDGGRLRHAAQGRDPQGDRGHHHARRGALRHAGRRRLMPSYYYRARDTFGRAHEGIEVAASEDEVLRALSNMKLTPVLIEARATNGAAAGASSGRNGTAATATARAAEPSAPFWSTWFQRQVQPGSVALFARQLATMMSAGLPLVKTLRSIARDHHDRRLSGVLEQGSDDVQKGEALAGALGRHPSAVGEGFVSLLPTREVSGSLDTVMAQTAGYLERAEMLRLKVEAALRYPTFILSFAGAVLVAMFFKIVPMFADIYARFRVQLPAPTRLLLAISNTLTHNALLVLMGALFLGLGLFLWLVTD